MDLRLAGARCLVTGGSGLVGGAVAASLVREGARVVLLGRTPGRLEHVAATIGAAGTVVADTTDDVAVRTAVDQVVQQLGGLDVLVNCAATPASSTPARRIDDVDAGALLVNVDTKVVGYLRVARAAAPFLARGGGALVNVSGTNARRTGDVVGSIRNSAVVALSKNLADELGPSGVAVTCVHPGPITTAAAVERAAPAGSLHPQVALQDVADLVVFLCSPRGRATNGSVVAADGGQPGVIWA